MNRSSKLSSYHNVGGKSAGRQSAQPDKEVFGLKNNQLGISLTNMCHPEDVIEIRLYNFMSFRLFKL